MLSQLFTLLLALGQEPVGTKTDAYAERFLAGAEALSDGAFVSAEESFRACLKLRPGSAACAFYLACASAGASELDEGMAWLQRSVDWGYEDAAVASWAPELSALRVHEGFDGLVRRMRKARAQRGKRDGSSALEWSGLGGSASLSRDGMRFLTDDCLWDVESGDVVGFIRDGEHGFRREFSGDGRFVVGLRSQRGLGLWDSASGSFIADLAVGSTFRADIAERGAEILVGAKVWDLAKRKLRISLATGHAEYGWLSPKSRWALTGDTRAATLCSTETGEVVATYGGPPSKYSNRWEGSFSFDENRAALLDRQTDILRVVDTATGDVLRELEDANDTFIDFALVPGPTELVTWDSSGRLKWWKLGLEDPVLELETLPATLMSSSMGFEVDARERYLLEATNKELRLLDLSTGTVRWHERHDTDRVQAVSFSQDGESVIVWLEWSRYELRDSASGRVLRRYGAAPLTTGRAAQSPNGESMAVPASDGSVRIVELETGRTQRVLQGHSGKVLFAVYAPNGQRVASVDELGLTFIWDASDSREIGRFAQPPLGIGIQPCDDLGLEFAPTGERVLVWGIAHGETSVRPPVIWGEVRRAARGELLFSLPLDDGDSFRSGAWSPDGARIALATENGRLVYVDSSSGTAVELGFPTQVLASCVAFHPDEQRLAVGSEDGRVRIWDTSTDELTCELIYPEDPFEDEQHVRWLSFSPDGSRLVSSVTDWGQVACWDVERAKRLWLHPLDGQWGVPVRTHFSPDASRVAHRSMYLTRIAKSDSGETVREWDMQGAYWLPMIRLGRSYVTAQAWYEWTVFEAESMAERYARVELPRGQAMLSAPELHFCTGPVEGLRSLLVVLDNEAYPFDCFAGLLLDPIKVRAMAAGIEVNPPRWESPPELEWVTPVERRMVVEGDEIQLEAGAQNRDQCAGFEVEQDGEPMSSERVIVDGWRVRLVLHRSETKHETRLSIRALGKSGLVSRPLRTTLRFEPYARD